MKKLIVANWKMNGSYDFIDDYFDDFDNLEFHNTVIFCPPQPYLGIVKTYVNDQNMFLGAQDCHEQPHGAYTGNISAVMLRDLGCNYVILGHSERRQQHLETNPIIKAKAMAALKQAITPIICVGETLAQRQSGQAITIVKDQLKECLPDTGQPIIVAYEPVWAIGTGLVATQNDIQEMHAAIYDYTKARDTKLLYGGSVNEANAHQIMAINHVDGVLVGGASLKPDQFFKIANL